MAHYLDPKNDLTFKRVFGEHPDLLIDFLNALMPLAPDRLIVEIEYLPVEQVPDIFGKKNSLVDVKCKDKSGRIFIVEMQMFWTDEFMQRIVFNASKAYVRQLDKNKRYNLLQPVYTLSILNKNFDHKTEQFYHHYSIINKENTQEVIEGLEFVLVELLKFKPEKWSERKIATLWLRFLSEVDEKMKSLPPELAANEKISKAAELCEERAFTEGELAAYEAYWDCIRVEKTLMESSKDEGEAIGLEKGEAIGLEKGRSEGEAIGLEKATITFALKLQKKGASFEEIAELTELTIEQVREILKQVR
jgi:predicted transposase/invertase (TIGR01784 family)